MLLGVLGGILWATGRPFVFPSLGPTAFVLALRPRQRGGGAPSPDAAQDEPTHSDRPDASDIPDLELLDRQVPPVNEFYGSKSVDRYRRPPMGALESARQSPGPGRTAVGKIG